MADTFATTADLENLLQTTLPAGQATLLLELSAGVIQAAVGQRILDTTDTAVVDVLCQSYWLDLPQYPIRSVSLVKIDGTTVTDYSIRQQRLWRASGWLQSISPPSQAIVTYAHGLTAGSQYLQLARTFSLSLAALGYGNPTGATSEAIDDYRVSYADAAARMELTEYMRDALIKAYGRSAYVTDSQED